MGMEHWDFLEKFIKIQKNLRAKGKLKSDEKISPDFNYIKDLVAGRPVLGYPLTKGGFRLRYGRTRINGFSATSLHPATMEVLNGYIATGTQLKVERPGKATVITPCDSIEGPIVKLNDGSVILLNDQNEAKKYLNQIEEILFLGDILINYGDFFNRAHKLVKPGYCEEWWFLEFEKAIQKKGIIELSELLGINVEVIKNLFKGNLDIKARDAVIISKKLKIPLHPRYTYHWDDINIEEFKSLLNWIKYSDIIIANNEIEKIIFPLNLEFDLEKLDPKRVLEILGVPHLVVLKESVVIEKDNAVAFVASLNLETKKNFDDFKFDKENVLEIVNKISEIKIKDKSGVFIGARMGRPEKAKMRKLTGSPHVLFPVGDEGGRLRCFQAAMELGKINGDFPIYICECGNKGIFPVCELCGKNTKRNYYCYGCGKEIDDKECSKHGKALLYKKQEIDIKKLFETSLKKLKLVNYPDLIKGVRGTSNEDHFPENLCKGILRAMEDVYVNKDGTIRYDMTELGITHFKPKEIGTSIEKLKELGYVKDVNGNELINDEQIIEIFPQDVILPEDGFGLEEGADEILFRISKFVDNLLVKFYGLNSFYNLKSKEETRGQLLLGLSPHTSAGILCRVIGFSKLQGFVAHPLLHSIMRRDCVHPKTKFVYYDCGRKELINGEIGTYVEALINNGAKTSLIDGVGTLKVENNKKLFALGIDPDTKELVYKKIKYFVKGPLTKEWIKVTTATNRENIMTPTHKFMYLSEEDKRFKFKEASEAKIGDMIPILDKLNVPLEPKDKIDLVNLFMENLLNEDKRKIIVISQNNEFYKLAKSLGRRKLSNLIGRNIKDLRRWNNYVTLEDYQKLNLDINNITLKSKFSNFKLNRFFVITPEFCEVLGYYISEGHVRSNKWVSQLSFRICNPLIKKKLVNLISLLFNCNMTISDDRITITNKLIYYFLKSLKIGDGAYSKRVPSFMFSLDKNRILSFIRAYFEGDGSVNTARSTISFYSVNHALLEDLALLLLRFGIIARYHKTKPRLPGKKILEIYTRLGKEPKKHILIHLIILRTM